MDLWLFRCVLGGWFVFLAVMHWRKFEGGRHDPDTLPGDRVLMYVIPVGYAVAAGWALTVG